MSGLEGSSASASPSVHQKFRYDALSSPREQIRLLTILPMDRSFSIGSSNLVACETFHVNLDSAPAYKALSYTWGYQNDQCFPILLNGVRFQVRENLWLALQEFHARKEPVIYWIDAVSIDQTNDEERSSQVSIMKSIYERASEVVVWLGPHQNDSQLVMRTIQELYDHRDSIVWIARRFQDPKAEASRFMEAFIKLLDREYWKRMWIVQELTVAKQITIRCGTDAIDVTALDEAQRLFSAANLENPEGSSWPFKVLERLLPYKTHSRALLEFRGMVTIRAWEKAFALHSLTYSECLLYHWTRESTDPKDMVYGLAALANSKSQYLLEVDYSLSVKEIYTGLARKEMQDGRNLNILTRAFSHYPNPHGHPSWVPDWAFATPAHNYLRAVEQPERFYTAAGTTTKVVTTCDDLHSIKVRAVVLGDIKTVGQATHMCDVEDRERAAQAFLAWWLLLPLPMDGTEITPIRRRFGRILLCGQFSQQQFEDSAMEYMAEFMLRIYIDLCREVGLDMVNNTFPVIAMHHALEGSTEYDTEIEVLVDKLGEDGTFSVNQELDDELMRRDAAPVQLDRAYVQASGGWIWDRRFFLGPSDIMGLAPQGVAEGDVICIPFGCPHPMIFRKFGGHHIVIGEAYVDGYMYGEAIEMLERGELKTETFELH